MSPVRDMKSNKYNPEIHHRRSIRLKGYDYAGGGTYFVTICAHHEFINFTNGTPFVGAIRKLPSSTRTSPIQTIIEQEWHRGGDVRDDVFPGEFVVMPDHFHGLIHIKKGKSELGHVIGAFKAAVSRRIRRGDSQVALPKTPPAIPNKPIPNETIPKNIRIWQRNYYEIIVRTSEAEKRISEYIHMNPWKNIIHLRNGMRCIGNPSLLNRQKIGMLCSRNCPQNILIRAKQRASCAHNSHCLMSGFHSPPEKDVLESLLQGEANIICCPAWGINTMKIPSTWLPALQQNRMMILEMTNDDGNIVTAKERNIFVMQSSEKLWFPYIASNGMLAKQVDSLNVADKFI